jgi:membrane-associated protein
VIPGETAVVIGGVAAYSGKVSLGAVIAAAIAGAVIGDSIGFVVGRRWGDTLLRRLPHKIVKPAHVQQSKDLIQRLGGRAVFAGRFAAALRALVPGVCGVSNMRYRTFLLWNVLGGSLWATAFVLLGYFAGASWHKVDHYASVAGWVLVGLIVVGGALLFVHHRRKEKKVEAEYEAREAPSEEEQPHQS